MLQCLQPMIYSLTMTFPLQCLNVLHSKRVAKRAMFTVASEKANV